MYNLEVNQNHETKHDCAISGDKCLFQNAEFTLAFWTQNSVKIFAENRPYYDIVIIMTQYSQAALNGIF